MRNLDERAKLKDIEFRGYKFKSKASKRVRARMRRAMKRGGKQYKLREALNDNSR